MPYDIMTVTTKGSQLFAQLAGDPNEHLVIEGCDADASVKDQTQALAVENRPSSPISTTDHIVLSGVTDHSFLVYAQFIAGQTTGGQVNSFYLYGYLESAPNNKYVIAVASDSRQSKLPSTQDIINYVEIRFSLTFTPIQSTLQVGVPSDNDYVLRSEFLQNINQISTQINNISDRVVTTHIEGDPTEGESQRIYGHKEFYDGVDFENDVSCQGSFFVTVENTYLARASITNLYDDINGYITLESGIRPIDNNVSLGSLGSLFKSIYSKDIYCRGLYPTESNTYSIGTQNIPWNSAYLRYIYNSELHTDCLCAYSGNSIISKCDLVPESEGSANIGSPSERWGQLYTQIIHTYSVEVVSGSVTHETCVEIDSTGVVLHYSSATSSERARGTLTFYGYNDPDSDGRSAIMHADINSYQTGNIYVYGSLIPEPLESGIPWGSGVSLENNIGSINIPWDNVYADNLHGKLPTVEYMTEPDVGAIFFAGVAVAGTFIVGIGQTVKVGYPITVGGSNVTGIGSASLNSSTGCFSSYTPFSESTGTYKLLCGSGKSASDPICFALVMRIA